MLCLPAAALAAYKDVPVSHPQLKAIETLKLEKIMEGFKDGTFKPDKPITRGDFLKTVFNDVGFKPAEKSPRTDFPITGFKDIAPQSELAGYIKKALELGIITPPALKENFDPSNPISKLEAVKLAFAIEGISTPYYSDIAPQDLFDDVKATSSFAYIVRAAKKFGIVSSKNPNLFSPFRKITRGDAAEIIFESQLIRQGQSADPGATETGEPELKITVTPSDTTSSSISGLDELSAKLINNPKFPILLDIWKKAYTDFYYNHNFTESDLVYGAVEGMVEKMKDKYTVFQEPLQASELNDYLTGELEGIGIKVQQLDNQFIIINPLPNTPAERAGLLPGDIIIQVDGKGVSEKTLEELLKMIKGPVGSHVKITVLRKSLNFDFDVERQKISINSVTSKLVNSNIGYVAISQFISGTEKEFVKQVNALLAQSAKGFIIDVRGNPGGYLDSANKILGHFVEPGKTVVSTKTTNGDITVFTSNGKAELAKFPVVILMNGDTASAAEILAGAIQDYQLGKLVGEKSFGKGSVQKLYSYPEGSILKMSIAHWLTPLGRDIHGISLIPDIQISRTKENIVNGEDPQLDRAIAEVQKGIK